MSRAIGYLFAWLAGLSATAMYIVAFMAPVTAYAIKTTRHELLFDSAVLFALTAIALLCGSRREGSEP